MSSKQRFNIPLQVQQTSNLNTAFGGTAGTSQDKGSIVFNTVTNSFSVFNGTTWDGLKESVNGKILIVDSSSANATDTRTGLSNYSNIFPFLTIQAAVNAFGVSDGYIHIKTGTYNENVSTTKDYIKLLYDNAVHTGTNVPALSVTNGNSGSSSLTIILYNSIIQNTGNSASRATTSAIYTQSAGQIFITGVGNYSGDQYGSVIQSVEGAAVAATLTGGVRGFNLTNLHLKSTNYYAVIPINDDASLVVNNCFIESTAASAIALSGIAPGPKISNSRIIGFTYAIDITCGNVEITDSYIESTNDRAISSANSLGGPVSIGFIVKNCRIKSKNEGYKFSTGNGAISWKIDISDTSFDIANNVTTLDFPISSDPASTVKLSNITSNRSYQLTNTFAGKVSHYYNRFDKVSYVSSDFLNGEMYFDNEGLYVGAAGTSGSIGLELNSTNKAFLPSRVANTAAITSPVNGMIVYSNAANDLMSYVNGAWVSLSTGASTSGGGSSGDVVGPSSATDNAIVRFDTATGKLIQNSVVTLGDIGATVNMKLANNSTTMHLEIDGSNASTTNQNGGDIILLTGAKATGTGAHGKVRLQAPTGLGGVDVIAEASDSYRQLIMNTGFSSYGVSGTKLTTNTIALTMRAAAGTVSATTGDNLLLAAGNAYNSGNTNGGHVYINGGAKFGTGTDGNIGFGTSSVSNWQAMEKGLFVIGATTNPTGNPSSGAFFYSDAADSYKPKWRIPSGLTYTLSDKNDTDRTYFEADEFIWANYGNGFAVDTGGAGASGLNDSYGVNNTENAFGVFALSTGTTNTGYAVLQKGANLMFGNGNIVGFRMRAALPVLSDGTDTYTVICGISTPTPGEPSDGIYFRYSSAVNGGNWQAVTRSGGTSTATDTGVAGTTTYSVFEYVANFDATSIAFKINGTTVATNTTNIPTTANGTLLFSIEKSAGTTSRRLALDWYNLTVDRTTIR